MKAMFGTDLKKAHLTYTFYESATDIAGITTSNFDPTPPQLSPTTLSSLDANLNSLREDVPIDPPNGWRMRDQETMRLAHPLLTRPFSIFGSWETQSVCQFVSSYMENDHCSHPSLDEESESGPNRFGGGKCTADVFTQISNWLDDIPEFYPVTQTVVSV